MTAEALDRDQRLHLLGIDAGVAQRDVAAERMGNERHRREPLLIDQLREVVDVAGHGVGAGRRPLAIAMAAQVGRDDVPVVAQPLRHPVPIAAMVLAAVQQDQRRRVRVAPVDVMQPQPLREIDPRGGAGGFLLRHGGIASDAMAPGT